MFYVKVAMQVALLHAGPCLLMPIFSTSLQSEKTEGIPNKLGDEQPPFGKPEDIS